MRVVFVGAGNLATRLSLEMRKSGMSIGQVYSHTSEHAKILADELGCGWTVIPEEIVEDADLYVFSLKDAVLQDVIASVKPNNGLWVHTAGINASSSRFSYHGRIFKPRRQILITETGQSTLNRT